MSTTTTIRRRRGVTGRTKGSVSDETKELAREYHKANREANAAETKAKKLRAQLFASMQEGKVTKFDCEVGTEDGGCTTITAEITTPQREIIDVKKLRKKVTDDAEFLKIVSATKKSVTDNVGGHVAAQCAITTPVTTNVSVKVKK